MLNFIEANWYYIRLFYGWHWFSRIIKIRWICTWLICSCGIYIIFGWCILCRVIDGWIKKFFGDLLKEIKRTLKPWLARAIRRGIISGSIIIWSFISWSIICRVVICSVVICRIVFCIIRSFFSIVVLCFLIF